LTTFSTVAQAIDVGDDSTKKEPDSIGEFVEQGFVETKITSS
jgi:hypothetical protein